MENNTGIENAIKAANGSWQNPVKDQNSRILYVEPNDVYGAVDGIAMTPDYTDMCISFNLVVEVVSRMRHDNATIAKENGSETNDGIKTYEISWTTPYSSDGSGVENKVSFMAGEKYGEKRYLTTYYVDNQYHDYKNKTIVEGLGVESVNITFENYFAPMVKIRFIDVRGASIFGREEAIHKDEKLMEDNIWGCFFTYPYPKYKLQVKGFYGKAVTFQLCCTDFRAKFNPNTGNYEIDMTFMGYDFGVLVDIPMAYLVAAPKCEYGGTQTFWDYHSKNDIYWKMSDGKPASTFDHIRKKIETTLETFNKDDEKNQATQEEIEEAIVDEERIAELDAMQPDVDVIQRKMKTVNQDFLGNGKPVPYNSGVNIGSGNFVNQFSLNKNKSWVQDTAEARRSLSKKFEEYKTKWPDSPLSKTVISFTFDDDMKSVPEETNTSSSTGFIGALQNSANNELPESASSLSGEKFSKQLETFDKNLKQERGISTKIVRTSVETTPMKDIDPKILEKNIYELAGFTPNIGNLFCTLYCHMETFIHMIYECVDRVYGQIERNERTLDKLGLPDKSYVNIETNETNPQLPPFPLVWTTEKPNTNNPGMADDVKDVDEGNDDGVKVDAWIGEVRDESATPWEEEVLINDIYKAVLSTMDNDNRYANQFTSTQYPVLPCDLNGNTVAGVGVRLEVEDLAGYLSLRAAAIFGVCDMIKNGDAQDIRTASAIGKADAINYFSTGGFSKDGLKVLIDKLNANTGENVSGVDRLYKIALSEVFNKSKGEKARFDFEKIPKIRERQPFFTENGETLTYVYTTEGKKGENGLVPVMLPSWDSITNGSSLKKNNDGKNFDIVLTDNKSDVLYKRLSSQIIELKNKETGKTNPKYINSGLFNVYIEEDATEKIEAIYSNLKEGNIIANGYNESDSTMFTTIVDKVWKNVTDEEYGNYYLSSVETLHLPVEKIGGNKPVDYKSYKEITGRVLKYSASDNKFKYNNNDVSETDYTVQPLISGYFGKTLYRTNIFTTDIYYKQNDIEDKEISDRTKAFLFLLTLSNGFEKKPFFTTNGGGSAKIEGVPYTHLLLCGALYWRERYWQTNDKDPILLDKTKYKLPKKVKSKSGNVVYEAPFFKIENDAKTYVGFIGSNVDRVNYIYGHNVLSDGKDLHQKLVDFSIKTRLIQLFEDFVSGDWKTIQKEYEIDTNYKDFIECISPESSEQIKANNEVSEKLNKKYGGFSERFTDPVSDTVGICVFTMLKEVEGEDETSAMDLMRDLCLRKVFVQKSVGEFMNDNGDIKIPKSAFKGYIQGFVDKLSEIAKSETNNSQISEAIEKDSQSEREIKRSIYRFVKNIWDRWLSSNSSDEDRKVFTAEKYMSKTLFIDSMYRNVYTNIHINCEILKDLLEQDNGESMAYKFITDITTQHHCMFFSLPDCVDIVSKNGQKGVEDLKAMFTPVPYSEMSGISPTNRFVVMFTHQPSEINENSNGYQYDGFDIYSHGNEEFKILSTFKKAALTGVSESANEREEQCNRYGYNIPAFGVEFGRQNNAIFKNVSVGMQNPVQTEQSIGAMSRLLSRGRGNEGQRMVFYGQDLYTIYSSYSYTATLEMMGNAQITPLMYFQLFNVPMFRGAYMIYKVNHTMRPGDMTTTATAMKMSKRTLPWCQEWFAHYYFDSKGNIHSRQYDDDCGAITDCSFLGNSNYHVDANKLKEHERIATGGQWTITHLPDKDTEKKCYDLTTIIEIKAHTSQTTTATWSIRVNKYIADRFIAVFDEIYRTKIKVNGVEKYLVLRWKPPTYGWRGTRVNGKEELGRSNHSYGVAVDINGGDNGDNPYNCQKALQISKVDTETCIRTTNSPFVKIFAKYGFGWGGRYNDFMHFSFFDGK